MNQIAAAVVARRARVSATSLKLLLVLTFVVAYLNAILRSSEDSIVTAFRVILPLVAAIFFAKFARHSVTRTVVLYMGIVAAYALVQMLLFGYLTDSAVWSYLINILALIAFVYFVYVYQLSYGTESLYRHLYIWYAVMVLAAIHQLLTGFTYPNAAYQDGVARIYFGQENETSLALAAFVPALLARSTRDPLAALLLAAGVCIIYLNSTRGVLVAVIAYPLMLAVVWAGVRFAGRMKALRPVVLSVMLALVVLGVYWLKDVPLSLIGDEDGSLSELLVDPLTHIAAGDMMDAELTSINLRVTLAIVGMLKYLATFGFGIGPGAATYFVREYYPGIALGMHIFPLQLLIECGWLFVATIGWIALTWGRRIGWQRFVPLLAFYVLATASITGSAITNYYFFACAVFSLVSAPVIGHRPHPKGARSPVPSTRANAALPAAAQRPER